MAFNSSCWYEHQHTPLPGSSVFIFGEEGKKFTRAGLHNWNRELLNDQGDLVQERMALVASMDLNELF